MSAVTLDPAVYWRLRYLQAESETASVRQQLAEARYQLALAHALAPHGGDPRTAYRWDDARCALVAPEASS